MVRSPIRWVGGKSKLRTEIIRLLPPSGTYSCYVEVFGGAGWVLFGKPPSSVEVLNDIDRELVNFFKVVKRQPSVLIHSLKDFELVSQARFKELLNTNPAELDVVSRAHRFYYLVMASWGGELGSARFQTSVSDKGGGNRLIGALATLEERLIPVHKRLTKVLITNYDWKECLDRFDDKKTVLYLDPPYPNNHCNFVHNMRKLQSHKELAQRLHDLESRWVLSISDTSDTRDLYAKYRIYPVRFASGMQGGADRVNKEILVTNFDAREERRIYEDVVSKTRQKELRLGDKVVIQAKPREKRPGRIVGYESGAILVECEQGEVVHVAPESILNRSAVGRATWRNRTQALNAKAQKVGHLAPDIVRELNAAMERGILSDPSLKVREWVLTGLSELSREK